MFHLIKHVFLPHRFCYCGEICDMNMIFRNASQTWISCERRHRRWWCNRMQTDFFPPSPLQSANRWAVHSSICWVRVSNILFRLLCLFLSFLCNLLLHSCCNGVLSGSRVSTIPTTRPLSRLLPSWAASTWSWTIGWQSTRWSSTLWRDLISIQRYASPGRQGSCWAFTHFIYLLEAKTNLR